MAKSVLKLTETLAVVKVTGAGQTVIDLATDLLLSKEELDEDNDPKVGISFVQWSTSTGVTITRGGVEVMALSTNPGVLDLSGNGGFADYTEESENITVNIEGAGVCFLTLRKAGGYLSKIEEWKFGQYDNPDEVGE